MGDIELLPETNKNSSFANEKGDLGQPNAFPHTWVSVICVSNTTERDAKPGSVIWDGMPYFIFDCRSHFRELKRGFGEWELNERNSELKIISV